MAVDDNDASPRIDWVVRVTAGGRLVARFRGRERGGSARLSGTFCSRARSHTVRLTIRDRGGHRVDETRTVAARR